MRTWGAPWWAVRREAAFLKPVHDILKENVNFQFLVKERAPILAGSPQAGWPDGWWN